LKSRVEDWITGFNLNPAWIELNLEPFSRRLDPKLWARTIDHLLENIKDAGVSDKSVLIIRLTLEEISETRAAELNMAPGPVAVLTFHQPTVVVTPETLNKAFDPFYSTRGKGKGKGLGMTLAHSVARFHGGQVTFSSSPEQGTETRIWIAEKNSIPEPVNPSFLLTPGL
jgi:sensor histidine kinase regulating citrate/malate metabolism